MGKKIPKRLVVFIMVFAVAGAILFLILREVVQGWPLIAAYPWELSAPLMALSLVVGMGSFLLAAKAAELLARSLGAGIGFRRLLLILCTMQISRYLPGRIWGFLGLSFMLEREGFGRTLAITLPVLHQGMSILALAAVGLSLSAVFGVQGSGHQLDRWAPVLVVFFFAALVLLPLVLRWGAGEKHGRPKWRYFSSLVARQWYEAVGMLLFSAVTLAAAFITFVGGLTKISCLDAPHIGGAFLLSYVAGWLAFFLPGGVGVREGALAYLLGSSFGVEVGSALALAARMWATLMEVVFLALVWLWVGGVKREMFFRRCPPAVEGR